MSESIKILNNIRTLRAQAREFSLETLDEMLEKLTTVVEERRQAYVSYRKEREERQAEKESIRLQLLEHYNDPADRPLNQNPTVNHDRLSTNTSMKTVNRRLGLVKVALLKLLPQLLRLGKLWKILRSNL